MATNKKLYPPVRKQTDSINRNSKIAFPERPASFRFAVDHYMEPTTQRLRESVPSEPWVNSFHEGPSDPVDKGILSFSELDKKVLKSLLYSSGKLSCLGLSRKLEIPYTTIQRRRKRLESEFLEKSCTLRLDRLGWRTADILVSTHKGMSSHVGKELLALSSITRVHRTIGEHTIDLHAETLFRNNKELLNVIEWVKSLDGVRDVVWTESVEMVGENTSMQYEIIDSQS
ncbi:MAG: Lrp/AsnC family transcriptional regulator [Nitrososphaera sp.]|nr:Lrp/AsnC family transcriptional regulator [Nitrososphaera sp.]